MELLRRWQPRINLVGASTLADPWRRHVLDSAQLAPLVPATARRLVDLGSGAGFPGLVLAALRPDLEVTLAESDQRKAAFLREAARAMGLSPLVHAARLETLPAGTFDVVTARALMKLDKLALLLPRLAPSGGRGLFPKGRTAKKELTEIRKIETLRATLQPSRSDPEGTIVQLDIL